MTAAANKFTGEYVEKLSDGTLYLNFLNGKKQGPGRFENNNKRVLYEMNFANDCLNGEFKQYYNNGTLMTVMNYQNGVLHGEFLMYYESGMLQMKINYNNGSYDGLMIVYDEFGDKISETPYKTGQKHGRSLKYYPKIQGGHVSELAYYVDGLLSGDKIDFSMDGNVSSVTSYISGRPQSYPVSFR